MIVKDYKLTMNLANHSDFRALYIWELPISVFHWSLMASVIGAFINIKMSYMDWHLCFG